MFRLLRMLWNYREDDQFGDDPEAKLRELDQAIAENISMREVASRSTSKLEHAAFISKLRSNQFAAFEIAIKEDS